MLSTLVRPFQCFAAKPSDDLIHDHPPTIPIAPLQATKIVDHDHLQPPDILLRSRTASSATARTPFILLTAQYNRRWYADIVNLPHDSVRLLLRHLFDTLTDAERLSVDMTNPDFSKLFAFIFQIDRYIRTLLDAEEKILFPKLIKPLSRLSDQDENLFANRLITRNEVKDEVHTKLRILRALLTPTPNLDDDVSIQSHNIPFSTRHVLAIQDCVASFANPLLEYFACKERVIPKILYDILHNIHDRSRAESRLIRFFAHLGSPERYEYVAILITPLKNHLIRHHFIKRHFPSSKSRAMLEEAIHNVNRTLLAISHEFAHESDRYKSRFSMSEFMSLYGTVDDVDQGVVDDHNDAVDFKQ